MTTSSVGASAPVPTPATPIATTAASLGLDPVAHEQHDQLVALATFLHDLTGRNSRAEPSTLRLLFQRLAPEHRPIALQALDGHRASMRHALDVVSASDHPPGQVAEFQRVVTRLDEVGVAVDAPSNASDEQSEQAIATFQSLLRNAAAVPGTERALRALFVEMNPEDRIEAVAQLTTVRDSESHRIQGIISANNGEVDPREFALLERLADVDAPVVAT